MIKTIPVRQWLPACSFCAMLVTGCDGSGGSDPAGSTPANQITTALIADPQVPSLELSSAGGTSILVVDSETGAISGSVTIAGLSSPARMAHIHYGSEGTDGPVLLALNIDEAGTSFTLPIDSALDAVGIDYYLNGELYVNVRTDDYPAGEIRAQLIPVDAEGRTRFSVQISNVSTDSTLSTPSTGGAVSVPLSSGAYLVHSSDINPFVQSGVSSSDALKTLSQNGYPYTLRAEVPGSGVFDTPDGSFIPSLIDSGESYTFTVTAVPGDKLSLLTMFVQSNDWFYSTHSDNGGISLFDDAGAPISGDVSDRLTLWESDTEEDQEPGTGPGQAPRQNVSEDRGIATVNGTVGSLTEKGKLDGLITLLSGEVIRVTITPLP